MNKSHNLLPYDGEAYYYGPILPLEAADEYALALTNEIGWQHDEVMMFGKRILTKRKVAWYGDEGFVYAYSGSKKIALPWTKHLRTLKAIVEKTSGATFNSCLLNYYHDGGEGMSWHSDDEPEMAAGKPIASLSLGAPRKFSFRHKSSGEIVSLVLEHGSVLVMEGATQTYWHHQLPKSKLVTHSRINLTFRTFQTK